MEHECEFSVHKVEDIQLLNLQLLDGPKNVGFNSLIV